MSNDHRKRPAVALGAFLLVALPAVGSAQRPDFELSGIDGVYKRQFRNGLASGERYTSEDVLEIVQIAPDRAYVRARINAFNGHFCAIWGIANVENATLSYSRPAHHPRGSTCRLVVRRDGQKIILSDGGSCRDTCGARATYDGSWFETAARREIRYMSRLTASKEYAEAIAESHR